MAKPKPRTPTQIERRARQRLAWILTLAGKSPSLRKLARAPIPWTAEFELVGHTKMRTLNRAWRGKNYATDVLSFRAPSLFRERGMIGELVICHTVAAQQAEEQGHSVDREMDVLLVHGVLHLLGLDHERSRLQAQKMARYERKLLRSLRITRSGLIARTQAKRGPRRK